MEEKIIKNFTYTIRAIKNAILRSRYRAAALANRELLSLYYGIGKYISENSRTGFWGTGAIEAISERLQQELPGLRGFSTVNIKRMRQFYEEWELIFANRPPSADVIRQLPTDELQYIDEENFINRAPTTHEIQISLLMVNRALPMHDLQGIDLHYFLSIGFTHHYEILKKAKTLEERLFYIECCATEFWSVEKHK